VALDRGSSRDDARQRKVPATVVPSRIHKRKKKKEGEVIRAFSYEAGKKDKEKKGRRDGSEEGPPNCRTTFEAKRIKLAF